MRKFFVAIFIIALFTYGYLYKNNINLISGAPPYGEPEINAPKNLNIFDTWIRPDGPTKVALQVGHYKNENLPTELEKLKTSTGSSGGGKWEWEVNLLIAEETKKLLEQEGILVEIIPATVPIKYYADVFVAIHADGSLDSGVRGFKVAPPWRDFTGNAKILSEHIENSYSKVTNLSKDSNITRNMRGYYAFSWWRYDHSVHPMTTAVILETGFLTNYSDQQLLINTPHIPAKGLADGIMSYLNEKNLL